MKAHLVQTAAVRSLNRLAWCLPGFLVGVCFVILELSEWMSMLGLICMAYFGGRALIDAYWLYVFTRIPGAPDAASVFLLWWRLGSDAGALHAQTPGAVSPGMQPARHAPAQSSPRTWGPSPWTQGRSSIPGASRLLRFQRGPIRFVVAEVEARKVHTVEIDDHTHLLLDEDNRRMNAELLPALQALADTYDAVPVIWVPHGSPEGSGSMEHWNWIDLHVVYGDLAAGLDDSRACF